jgi:hypothetical protein
LYLTVIVLILLSLTALGGQITNAQQSKSASTCPVIEVSCPEFVDQFETMVCSATVFGGSDLTNMRFSWKVSLGKIIKGQDTASIEVETRGLFPGVVNATVEVAGTWPSSCSRQATASSALVISDPGPQLFEKYGEIPFEKEKEYLHRYALLLGKDPGSQPYILAYAGRRALPNEALERGKRVKNRLVAHYGIQDKRVVVVDAGYRETPAIELWLVPQGAEPPLPTPTIDKKEVEMLKGKPLYREHKNPGYRVTEKPRAKTSP